MFHSTPEEIRRKQHDSQKTVIFPSQRPHLGEPQRRRFRALSDQIRPRKYRGFRLFGPTIYSGSDMPKPQKIVTPGPTSGIIRGILRWVLGSHKAMQLSTAASTKTILTGHSKAEIYSPDRRPSATRSLPDIGSELSQNSWGRRPSISTKWRRGSA